MKINWKKIKSIADRNAFFLENAPEDFIKDVKNSEGKLFKDLSSLIDDFETEDGRIKKSTKNLFMVNKVDQVFKSFSFGAGIVMITSLITKLQTTLSNSFNYYSEIVDSKASLFSRIKDTLVSLTNKRIGINDEGKAVNGGYISDLLNMTNVRNETRELIYRRMLSEPTPTDLKNDVQLFISGDSEKDVRGAIEKFYARFTGSSFGQIDRMASLQFANEYQLTQFLYYGTIIKTSRPFCKRKINGIYTITEGMQWPYENPKPLGISIATYNPAVDMGGENCRHLPMFLTDAMAQEMKDKGFSGFNG